MDLRIDPFTFNEPAEETLIVGLPDEAYSISLSIGDTPTFTVPPLTVREPFKNRSAEVLFPLKMVTDPVCTVRFAVLGIV